MSSATTIRDVAEEAEVSATTVSRVFNHGHLVKEATRARVREAARVLGYAPNPTARSLKRGRTQALGVVLPVPHGEFFSELIRGLDEAAQAHRHHLLISSSHYDPEESRAALDALAGRVDGLVVMAPHMEAGAWTEWLRAGPPVVFLNTAMPEDAAQDSFEIENRSGAARVVRHLLDTGRRRVAAITGPRGSHDVEERLAGYHAALTERGLEPGPVLEGAFTQKSGYEAGRRLAALDGPRPDAVFACNDYMALGAMAALQAAGVRVPEDVAVAGFDDVQSARYAHPPLTTARVPVHALGGRAAKRLLARIEAGGQGRPETHTVPCELKVRGSTAAAETSQA